MVWSTSPTTPTTATFGNFVEDETSDDEESENTCACELPEFEPTHTWSLNPWHSDPERTMPLAKDATKTLTIKARVKQNTRGQNFTVKAMISATQTSDHHERQFQCAGAGQGIGQQRG